MTTNESRNDKQEITHIQRMLSACVGSFINSFAVTPFDVIRIRLQQQQLINNSITCCKDNAVFWQKSCMSSCSAITPQYTGTWQAMKYIAKVEGVKTLWTGVSLALIIAIPGNMVYFAGYDFLKSKIGDDKSWNPLISGAIARTLAVITVSPIELIRTRLQAMPYDNKKMLRTLLLSTYKTIQAHGYQTLFKGLELTLWRDVPFSSIYWLSYEYWKKEFLVLGLRYFPNFYRKEGNHHIALTSFISGSLSGTTAAIFTNPFDVGKTRLQVSSDEVNKNALLSKIKKPGMFRFLYNIVKTEGFGALYVGLIPRILKIAPSCAVMISTYELSKNYFHQLQKG